MKIVILMIILGCIGCGSQGERTPTAKVFGTVQLDGRPLEQGTIIFESSGSRPATGKIDQGRIVDVMTYEAGDGVPVGKHQIAVQSSTSAAAVTADNPSAQAPVDLNYMGGGDESLIPQKYTNPATSGLTAEIVAGENQLKLELKSN